MGVQLSEKPPASDTPDDRLYVQSVEKAFRLLEAFATATGPLSLSQLAAASGLDKSGAQRMGHTLAKLGYLEQTQTGLRPGHRILERSFDYLRTDPLVRRALPILAELKRETQQRVDLSRFDDLHMLYLVRLQSKRESFNAYLIGRRVPIFCTSGGRAVLARLPKAQMMNLLQRSDRIKLTPKTTTSLERTVRLVAQAQADGYALALEEVLLGEIALAAAVTDESGRPVGAIHLAGSLSDWTAEEFARRFAPLVVDAAHAASFA
jgi:IclR family transcriptional regulator, pca regulon regulatory protein